MLIYSFFYDQIDLEYFMQQLRILTPTIQASYLTERIQSKSHLLRISRKDKKGFQLLFKNPKIEDRTLFFDLKNNTLIKDVEMRDKLSPYLYKNMVEYNHVCIKADDWLLPYVEFFSLSLKNNLTILVLEDENPITKTFTVLDASYFNKSKNDILKKSFKLTKKGLLSLEKFYSDNNIPYYSFEVEYPKNQDKN